MNKDGLTKGMYDYGRNEALKLRQEAISRSADRTAIIAKEEFVPEWREGPYNTVGAVVREGTQIYRVLQAHDSTGNPGWKPSATPALFEVYHTKDPAKAKPYVAPYGTSGLYDKDEVCLWTDGIVYKSLVDNNAYSPADYAANWEKVV